MNQASLILEGGGMRGVYTCGVLDFFHDKEMDFETVIGVSAGACNGCSLLSKQRGRAYAVTTDYLDNSDYLSVRNLIKTKSAFGLDFIFDEIPNKLNPFDYDAFRNNKSRLYAVSTDLETGDAVYRPIINMRTDLEYVKASMSLPLLSPPVEIDGKKLLDGGVADSIPIRFALDLGYDKNIIVLTQYDKYVKGKSNLTPLISKVYRKYPKFIKKIQDRHLEYNNTMNLIRMLEREGKAFVIQPKDPVTISRLEKNKDNLKQLYELGYQDAQASYENLKNYLKSRSSF